MKKGERTRQKMIDTTARLLQRQGYAGTGLAAITKESGAPRGSLYHHFPGGKQELACAAITSSGDDFLLKLFARIDPSDPLPKIIDAIITLLADDLESSSFEDGCPVAVVALETATTEEPLRQACSAHFARWQELLVATLVARGYPQPEAADRAALMLSSIEGALLLSRVHRDTTILRRVGTMLVRLSSE